MVTNDKQSESHELKGVKTHFPLSGSCIKSGHRWWPSLVLLCFIEIFPIVPLVSLSKRFGVSIGSLYYCFLYLFFLISIHKSQDREKNKEEKNKKTLKMYRNFDDDITNTVRKILMGWIQWHLEKSINSDWSELHKPSKNKCASTPLDNWCNPLRSSLITFIGFIRFISSGSLQRYQLFPHWNVSVSLRFFSFFPWFFSFPSLIFLL